MTDSRKDTCHSRVGTRHRRTQGSSAIPGWNVQVALPWGISCCLSVSIHLRQLRKRSASSLPSSYRGCYRELGMRQWSLETGWFAVDGPCTPVPGSQLRKKVRGGCLDMGIQRLFAPSARIVVGAPWGTWTAPGGSHLGRGEARPSSGRQDPIDLSLTPFLPQVSCHCSLGLPPPTGPSVHQWFSLKEAEEAKEKKQ